MNDDELPSPPYSAELLADLHAGVLDEKLAARLWPLVEADPAAVEYLARLDATRDRLADLREQPPSEPIPPAVAARIEAALAAERGRGAAGAARRRWFTVAGVGAAAAIAVVLVVVLRGTAFGEEPSGTAPIASAPSETELFEPGSVRAMIGRTSLGPLGEGSRLQECLSANGFDDMTHPLGAREVRFRDQDAVLMVVGGPEPPALTVLVVGTSCGSGDPATLERRGIG